MSALAKAQDIEWTDPKDGDSLLRWHVAYLRTLRRADRRRHGTQPVAGSQRQAQSAEASYAATQELVQVFENEFGGRNCEQLLGCDISTPEGQLMFGKQELHTRCERYTSEQRKSLRRC
ncbi:MAG: C-GCAxxG-C-C family protein [Ilumatobacteraceae bacterium]